jgi:hypothetical protein
MDRNRKRITPQETLRVQRPLETLEELIEESLDPRAARQRFGLPHPLSKFTSNGTVKEGQPAEVILRFIHDIALEDQASMKHEAAHWFLFESQRAFFFACSEAGIDAEKLKSHLRLCEQLSPDEMDELLEERARRERP